jgi:hypothetical protein
MTPEQSLFELLEKKKPTAPSEGSSMEQEIKAGDPDFSLPLTLRNIFIHHDSHPIVLNMALLKAFGLHWYTWEPETVWAEIKRVFNSEVSEHSRAKINALKAIMINTMTWNSWQVFEKVIQALNNNIPRWAIMQAPTIEQLYAGIDILDSLRQVEYGDEVKRYIAACVLNEDIFYVPPPLDFVQTEVSHPYYLCKDCGNEDSALFHDGLCDTCTGKFDTDNGLSFRPNPEVIASGKGKNLELRLRFDPSDTEKRWHQLKDKPSDQIEFDEVQADIQVAKLLVARDYMNIRRRQLAEQLIALKSWLEAE